MNPDTRYAIAYIIGRLATGQPSSSVYSYDDGVHHSISGTVSDLKVDVFDYSTSSNIGGSGANNKWNLFHYGHSSHVSLERRAPDSWNGFDYGTSSHYSATTNDRDVSLFDYGDSSYHNYSV
ncbi:MAG TPA: hypothetical protein VG815_22440 [Chloroflexota bacterium]|jgi:hypothetical protein|nr:hypothetical protein [Chloroflexota bacterium]